MLSLAVIQRVVHTGKSCPTEAASITITPPIPAQFTVIHILGLFLVVGSALSSFAVVKLPPQII